jgi:hypothetical protein
MLLLRGRGAIDSDIESSTGRDVDLEGRFDDEVAAREDSQQLVGLLDRETAGLDLGTDPFCELGLRLDIGAGVLGGIDEGVGAILVEVAREAVDDGLSILLVPFRPDAHARE